MRYILLLVTGLLFVPPAKAVECVVDGVYRAGCVAPYKAAVKRKPYSTLPTPRSPPAEPAPMAGPAQPASNAVVPK